MNELSEKIKEISDFEFPPGLHGKIMKHVAFLQFRTPFLVIVSLLTLNLVVSGYQIWNKSVEIGSFGIFRDLLSGIDWSPGSAVSVFQTFNELFPLGLLLTFVANILLVGYLIYIMQSFKKLAAKNSDSI